MTIPVTLRVNGRTHRHDVEPRLLLVHYLRQVLGLTGTKIGCDTSQCGSCTVLVDGIAVKSCTCLTAQADGADGHDHRRARPVARRAASGAGSVLGQAWAAVRLLHAGDGLRRLRAAAQQPHPLGGRDPPRPRRQPVPLHRLPEHRPRRAGRCRSDGRAVMSSRIFGSAIRRREDPRLLTGTGTFTDDLALPGMVHAAMLRSPHAHARIRSVDTAPRPGRRRRRRGRTPGRDIAGALKPMPCAWLIPNSNLKVAEYPCMATDVVRYVGDIVAVVVAETSYEAEDALELIDVDYEPLAAVVDPQEGRVRGRAAAARLGAGQPGVSLDRGRRRRRRGVRGGGRGGQGPHRPAAADSDGDGAAFRRRAVERRPPAS